MNTHTPYDNGFRDVLNEQHAYAQRDANDALPALRYIALPRKSLSRRQKFFRWLVPKLWSLFLAILFVAYGVFMYCWGMSSIPAQP